MVNNKSVDFLKTQTTKACNTHMFLESLEIRQYKCLWENLGLKKKNTIIKE